MKAEISDSTFAIGAVARLTGIPMDTLRIWERRYRAVVPQRSSRNRRFYTRDDVTRLMLIKQLIEQGESVGTIVHLDESELRERLEAHAELKQGVLAKVSTSDDSIAKAATVLVFGEALPYQMRIWCPEMDNIDLLDGHNLFSEFEQSVMMHRPDVLVMEFPALQLEAVSRIQELMTKVPCQRVIVVYSFASRPLLERLGRLGVIALRAPVTPAILKEVCQGPRSIAPLELRSQGGVDDFIPQRFSAKQLAVIGSTKSGLVCECPQHLVDLVSRVGAFERYSLDCELRTPEDAVIHERLYRMTSQARATLESALAFLLESEGIEVPDAVEPDRVTTSSL